MTPCTHPFAERWQRRLSQACRPTSAAFLCFLLRRVYLGLNSRIPQSVRKATGYLWGSSQAPGRAPHCGPGAQGPFEGPLVAACCELSVLEMSPPWFLPHVPLGPALLSALLICLNPLSTLGGWGCYFICQRSTSCHHSWLRLPEVLTLPHSGSCSSQALACVAGRTEPC